MGSSRKAGRIAKATNSSRSRTATITRIRRIATATTSCRRISRTMRSRSMRISRNPMCLPILPRTPVQRARRSLGIKSHSRPRLNQQQHSLRLLSNNTISQRQLHSLLLNLSNNHNLISRRHTCRIRRRIIIRVWAISHIRRITHRTTSQAIRAISSGARRAGSASISRRCKLRRRRQAISRNRLLICQRRPQRSNRNRRQVRRRMRIRSNSKRIKIKIVPRGGP